MNKLLVLILVVALFFRCTESKDNSEKNLDALNIDVEVADDGGEIDVSKITHGDKPIWLEFIETNDLDSLDIVLKNKDTLNSNLLTYKDVSPWDMKLNQLVSQFKLKKYNEDSESSFWVKDDIKSSFRNDSLISLSGIDIDQLELYEKSLSEYTIKDFKMLFPKSYNVRNYYFDSYQVNFVNKIPDSYDHLVMIADKSNKYFHFHFVNENIVHLAFNDDRGY
jgi:hypothetical protein